jgi:hypothetical protein
MPSFFKTRGRIVWTLTLASLVVSGCAQWKKWNWRGEGYTEEQENMWGEKVRPGTGEKPTGLSTRAQQIERNLGYR